jgi:hypothetical protein
MEFLRFGSNIPGAYWGCCACDIIQNFKVDPDEKASIQIVDGDSNTDQGVFAGPTYRDIFHQRLRFGTFSKRDMPNHAFIAILTDNQISGGVGLKWLKILKECGFEFIRTVDNSVYSGTELASAPGEGEYANGNHIFMLVRNIGEASRKDPFTPPAVWASLPAVKTEAWQMFTGNTEMMTALVENQFEADKKVWDKLGPAKLLKESEVVERGVPVMMAGIRPENYGKGFHGAKPELKKDRERRQQEAALMAANLSLPAGQPAKESPNPFGVTKFASLGAAGAMDSFQ